MKGCRDEESSEGFHDIFKIDCYVSTFIEFRVFLEVEHLLVVTTAEVEVGIVWGEYTLFHRNSFIRTWR